MASTSGNDSRHDTHQPEDTAPADLRDTVVGVYDDYADAEGALQALTAAGFAREAIHIASENASEAAQPAMVSTGHQHGAAGITNFFRSLFGIDNEAHHEVYAESVRRGSYVLTIDTQNDEEIDRATHIMGRFNPLDIDELSSAWRQQGWSGQEDIGTGSTASATSETSRIPVIEEELTVGKREVQRGGVRVFRRVSEKPVHESVQLREEHVKVERHAVDKPASEADLGAFKEGSVEMREMAEEPVVAKTAHVVEEVVVNKEVTQKTEEINDTVRRTDVDVEQIGASGVDAWRHHWQDAYGRSGGRYEDYDAAYRYGSAMAGTERFRNYRWEDAEPDLRSDWERQHPESAWDKVKDAVRYGAESTHH
ncbi:MAG TPA: YsnF/AvaK domain-containing protein [Noviherbaspirillum sp.]|uniref:YsnF/AvaK domain-containing protein n=1 Tax=Noviherbaspirillum sp. TaxID=1926288 RepID=UPI002B47D7B6|nr:YsnF/AvaK domain-containing protein [Noviherbaspirillum sp.]HJV87715.1 YsnF/AvaK domain-containing protein [Noviherbaspirillum sp.]